MKNIRSITAIIVCLTILAFCLTACGKNKTVTKVISEPVTEVNITTEASTIYIRTSQDEDVHITMSEKEEDYLTIEDGVLEIDIPASNKKVNFDLFGSNAIIVEIPSSGCESISINAEAGDITINENNADSITAHTENGTIKLVGLTGNLFAKTAIGEIKTKLPIKDDVITGEHEMGASLEVTLGDAGSMQVLEITTVNGDISIE